MTPVEHEDRIRQFAKKWSAFNIYRFKNGRLIIRKKPSVIYLIYAVFLTLGGYMVQGGGMNALLFGWPICVIVFLLIIDEEVFPRLICDFNQMNVSAPGLFNRKKYHADQIKAFKIGAAADKSYSRRGYKAQEYYIVQQIWIVTLDKKEVKIFRYPGAEREVKSFVADLAYLLANAFEKRVRRH
jgi:hypothetical protein